MKYFSGRINRKTLLVNYLIMSILFSIVPNIVAIKGLYSSLSLFFAFVVGTYLVILTIILLTRRAHDIGWGGKKLAIIYGVFIYSVTPTISIFNNLQKALHVYNPVLTLFLSFFEICVFIISCVLILFIFIKPGTKEGNTYGPNPGSSLKFLLFFNTWDK